MKYFFGTVDFPMSLSFSFQPRIQRSKTGGKCFRSKQLTDSALERLSAPRGFHPGLPAGFFLLKHRPEVFLTVAFLQRTAGSFCPWVRRARQTEKWVAAGVPRCGSRGLVKQGGRCDRQGHPRREAENTGGTQAWFVPFSPRGLTSPCPHLELQ